MGSAAGGRASIRSKAATCCSVRATSTSPLRGRLRRGRRLDRGRGRRAAEPEQRGRHGGESHSVARKLGVPSPSFARMSSRPSPFWFQYLLRIKPLSTPSSPSGRVQRTTRWGAARLDPVRRGGAPGRRDSHGVGPVRARWEPPHPPPRRCGRCEPSSTREACASSGGPMRWGGRGPPAFGPARSAPRPHREPGGAGHRQTPLRWAGHGGHLVGLPIEVRVQRPPERSGVGDEVLVRVAAPLLRRERHLRGHTTGAAPVRAKNEEVSTL